MNVKLGLDSVVLSTEIMSKSHLFLLSDVMHVHAFQWSLYWFKHGKHFKMRQVKTIMVHFLGRFNDFRALNIFQINLWFFFSFSDLKWLLIHGYNKRHAPSWPQNRWLADCRLRRGETWIQTELGRSCTPSTGGGPGLFSLVSVHHWTEKKITAIIFSCLTFTLAGNKFWYLD